MSIRQNDSGSTSNDLLSRLAAKQSPPALNYQIIAQNAEDVQNIENAPAVPRQNTIRPRKRLSRAGPDRRRAGMTLVFVRNDDILANW
jgi:hypothetical protein